MRPKIYFVPSYIGSLKYLEKVALPLRDKYIVGFLIIHPNKRHRQQMIEYCKRHNLLFFPILEGMADTSIHIPVLSELWKRYKHSKACHEFLKTEKPVKIISTKAKYPHDTILKEANRLHIETILLQWSYYNRRYTAQYNTKSRSISLCAVRVFVYETIMRLASQVLDIPFTEARYGFTLAVPKKVGVFDEEEAEYRAQFFAPHTIRVIGPIDFQIAHELKRNIDSNTIYRKTLLGKYNLSSRKTKIIVVISRHYPGKKDSHGLHSEEHIAFHYTVFKTIRDIFPEREADIIFKLHPAEGNAYESYANLGVRIYGDEARIDELVCLSHLYIADAATNVNYLALGSNTPAIFMNFYPIKAPQAHIKHYYIADTALNLDAFSQKLKQFKNGMLPKQYDNTIHVTSLNTATQFIID